MQKLNISARILSDPIRLSSPCIVEVRLINKGPKPLLINGRLSVGYRHSQSREVFCEVIDSVTKETVSKQSLLYDREYARSEDYVWVQPNRHVSKSFDLFEWYSLPTAGDYKLVLYYQADEVLVTSLPNLVRGVYSSELIDLLIEEERG